MQLTNYEPKKEPFWKRYFFANKLLVAMWLIWLPNVMTVVFPCWALYLFNTSGIPPNIYNDSTTITQELIGNFFALWITFFWVYASFPEMMRKNGTYGSVTFLYYVTVFGPFYLACTCFGCGDKNQFESIPQTDDTTAAATGGENEETKPSITTQISDVVSNTGPFLATFFRTLLADIFKNPFEAFGKYFQRPFFGSDFSVGAAWFTASSFVGFVMSSIDYNNYYTDYGLGTTILYFIGAAWIWLASYPLHMAQNDYVGSTITRDVLLFIFCGCGLVGSASETKSKEGGQTYASTSVVVAANGTDAVVNDTSPAVHTELDSDENSKF